MKLKAKRVSNFSRVFLALTVGIVGVGFLVSVFILTRPINQGEETKSDTSLNLHPSETTWPVVPDTALPPLKIASATAVNINGPLEDGQVSAAYDDNNETSWLSQRFRAPKQRAGIGLALHLESPALVKKILVKSSAQGGVLELRSTTADNPGGGVLLGSEPLGEQSIFTLPKNTELSDFVLFSRELPKGPGGQYRLIIDEVKVLGSSLNSTPAGESQN